MPMKNMSIIALNNGHLLVTQKYQYHKAVFQI